MNFIPPPYPFPEKWPQVFQRKDAQWLTPNTQLPLIHVHNPSVSSLPTLFPMSNKGTMMPPPQTQYHWPSRSTTGSYQEKASDGDKGNEENEDSEYEYGFVLSDEWRGRFQQSKHSRQHPGQTSGRTHQLKQQYHKSKKKKTQRQQKSNNATTITSYESRLQQELQAAKSRELKQMWQRRQHYQQQKDGSATGTAIMAMETQLNMLFDRFCDTHNPVVWPAV